MAKLIIGDLHAPFEHWAYLRFLKRIKREHDIDEVISIGDITDQYTISKFLADPEAQDTITEWEQAKETLKLYHGELGLSTVITGNHDIRLNKRSREAGLPDSWLREVNDIYGLPGVRFVDELVEDGVLYIHGVNAGGESGWQQYSKANGMSTVFGHYHSVGGIRYHQMRDGSLLYSMCVGCGVDKDAYAFAYAKGNPKLPVLGAGVVYGPEEAYFIPFVPSDRRNRRRD